MTTPFTSFSVPRLDTGTRLSSLDLSHKFADREIRDSIALLIIHNNIYYIYIYIYSHGPIATSFYISAGESRSWNVSVPNCLRSISGYNLHHIIDISIQDPYRMEQCIKPG